MQAQCQSITCKAADNFCQSQAYLLTLGFAAADDDGGGGHGGVHLAGAPGGAQHTM